MQLIDTRVTPGTPGMGSYLIEFVGEGGESISVTLKDDRTEAAFDIDGLIEKAKAIMIQTATISLGTAASAELAEISSSAESYVAIGEGTAQGTEQSEMLNDPFERIVPR